MERAAQKFNQTSKSYIQPLSFPMLGNVFQRLAYFEAGGAGAGADVKTLVETLLPQKYWCRSGQAMHTANGAPADGFKGGFQVRAYLLPHRRFDERPDMQQEFVSIFKLIQLDAPDVAIVFHAYEQVAAGTVHKGCHGF